MNLLHFTRWLQQPLRVNRSLGLNKKIYLTCLTLTSLIYANGQDRGAVCTADFEDLTLPTESHWDGSDQSGGFMTSCSLANWTFANVYDTAFGGYWAGGWVYSNETDVATTGNQFSTYAGGGYMGTGNYAIASAYGPVGTSAQTWAGAGNVSFYVANSTYSAISMRDGDMFGKKFGDSTDANGAVDGTNGEDWFKLTVKSYLEGFLVDSQEVYLADFRFAADSLDYISDTWQLVSFSGALDSLSFSLSSSDTSSWGMNTPAFFCLDHIIGDYPTDLAEREVARLSFYPNPAPDQIRIEDGVGQLEIYSVSGALIKSQYITGNASVDVSHLNPGLYQLILKEENRIRTSKLIKR